jgi:hypothetical protein
MIHGRTSMAMFDIAITVASGPNIMEFAVSSYLPSFVAMAIPDVVRTTGAKADKKQPNTQPVLRQPVSNGDR